MSWTAWAQIMIMMFWAAILVDMVLGSVTRRKAAAAVAIIKAADDAQ